MGFTRMNDNVSVHQSMPDEPNIDDGLSAEELKKKFDEPSEKLKQAFNDLISEIEATTGASQIGSSALKTGDLSENNVQAKLESLQSQVDDLKSGELIDGSIVTSKIADSAINSDKLNSNAVVTDKIADNSIVTSKIADSAITTSKINNGAITGEKIDSDVKKASNISATIINSQDTSEANVQAKLNKIYADLIDMTQGAVADNSISSNKLEDNCVINTKIPNNSITEDKIVTGLGLVPSGLICMWSGSTVPTGWYLCDGTNGTPDLRDRFVVGAGNEYSIGDTGGEKNHILTESEMPSHTHKLHINNTNFAYYSTESDTEILGTSSGDAKLVRPKRSSSYYSQEYSMDAITQATGDGSAHENRPPYYALAFIMKA